MSLFAIQRTTKTPKRIFQLTEITGFYVVLYLCYANLLYQHHLRNQNQISTNYVIRRKYFCVLVVLWKSVGNFCVALKKKKWTIFFLLLNLCFCGFYSEIFIICRNIQFEKGLMRKLIKKRNFFLISWCKNFSWDKVEKRKKYNSKNKLWLSKHQGNTN